MPWRRYINAGAIAFATVIVCSFAAGCFMLVQRSRPAVPPRNPSISSPEGPNTAELLTAAGNHLQEGRTEQALIAYRHILAGDPGSAEAQIGLARGELQAGREDIALAEFQRAFELDSDKTVAILEVARIHSHRAKTWPQAEAAYREYLNRRPEDSGAWLDLARVLALQKKSAEAADIFGRADVQPKMTAKDQRDFAFALVRAGRLDAAEVLLKKLLASQSNDFDLEVQLAGIYSSRRDWDRALPLYQSLLRKKPADSRVNLTYGLGLLSLKRYREALGPLEKARNGMPRDGEAGLGLARALKGAGDLKKADREFERVLPLYSGNTAIRREYADLLLERKDYRKAEVYYKEAYGGGLRDDRLLVGLAGALSGTRKYKEAIPYLEQAYEHNRTDRLALELAKLYQKTGRTERSIALISTIERR